MLTKKYSFIVGQMACPDCMWLEFHSDFTDTIYVTVVRDKNEMDMLANLNIKSGSIESYRSINAIIGLSKKNAIKLHISEEDKIYGIRSKLCKSYFSFEFFSDVNAEE